MLYKRGKTWHADFTVNGARYRQSLHTPDWREAQSIEKERIAQASAGKLPAASSRQFARLGFAEAAKRYLDGRKPEVSLRTVEKDRDSLCAPARHFRNTPLRKITVEDLRAYREKRAAEGKANSYINMELGAVRRVLKRARLWHLYSEDLKPLPERHREARVLTPDEKLRLLRKATSRPEWLVARLAMNLTLNTTMRGCEIRGLRWRDVDFIQRTLTIRRSKTKAGERVIPLNADAWVAIVEAHEHSKEIFGRSPEPDWYVFPHEYERDGHWKPDPLRSVKGWRTAWRALTRAVECPSCGVLQSPGSSCSKCSADLRNVKSPLAGLRFHDLRHHAITELAESLASDQTIMSIAGHVSRQMLEHYSHVRLEAKRRALAALSSKAKRGVTSQTASQTAKLQISAVPN